MVKFKSISFAYFQTAHFCIWQEEVFKVSCLYPSGYQVPGGTKAVYANYIGPLVTTVANYLGPVKGSLYVMIKFLKMTDVS